jgi:hypothetical protein
MTALSSARVVWTALFLPQDGAPFNVEDDSGYAMRNGLGRQAPAAFNDDHDLLRIQRRPDRLADLVHLRRRSIHPQFAWAGARAHPVVPGLAEGEAPGHLGRQHGMAVGVLRARLAEPQALRPHRQQLSPVAALGWRDQSRGGERDRDRRDQRKERVLQPLVQGEAEHGQRR